MAEETLVLLSQEQIQAVSALFQQNNWDLAVIETPGEEPGPELPQADIPQQGEHHSSFVTVQDPDAPKCPHCFCSPCITSERNRQNWWGTGQNKPARNNRTPRYQAYSNFWTMMYHRNVWESEDYKKKKADVLQVEYTQPVTFHKRDIMPECVLNLVRF